MKTLLYKLFSAVLLVNICTLAFAESKPLDSKQISLINKVLEVSGAKRQIANLPDVIISQASAYKDKMEPELYQKMNKTLEQSFRGDLLYADVIESFKQNFDETRLTAILLWLRSPLTRKISNLEIAASTPESMEERQNYNLILRINPPAQYRLEMVQEFDEVTGSSKLNTDIMLVTYKEMIKAVSSIMPQDKNAKADQGEDMFNKMKPQISQNIKNLTLLSSLFIYRSLSEDEFRKYIDFYKTEDGKWFIKNSSEATLKAMTVASERMGKQLTEMFIDARNKLEASLKKEGLTQEEFANVNYFYYMNPQKDKLIAVLRFYLAQDGFMHEADRIVTFGHFVASAVQKDKTLLVDLEKLKGQYSGKQKQIIVQIVNESNKFKSLEPDSAKHLDCLWVEFLATGEEMPIKKMISVLNDSVEGEKGILVEPVALVLVANAKAHKKVYETIQAQYSVSKGLLRERLSAILQRLEPEIQK